MEMFSASRVIDTFSDLSTLSLSVNLPTFVNPTNITGIDLKVVEKKDNLITLQLTELFINPVTSGSFKIFEQYKIVKLPRDTPVSDLAVFGTDIVGGIFLNFVNRSTELTKLLYIETADEEETWLIANYQITDT